MAKTNLVGLDMSSPADSQLFDSFEHQITVAFGNCKIYDGSRTRNIFEMLPHIKGFEV